jgi:Carboxypeptidase regulatory-like domain
MVCSPEKLKTQGHRSSSLPQIESEPHEQAAMLAGKPTRNQHQRHGLLQVAPSIALRSLSRPGRFMARRAKAWKSYVSAALVLLALFVLTLPVLAAVTGDIRGIVLDPQGLPVAAAEVTVRNLETGVSRSVATDSAGAFATLQLAVGSYEVRIEKQGFLALVTTVDVRSGEVAEADGSLQVGSVNQSVTVAAGARTYLDAASAQVATSLDATTIQDIPSLDRDPVALTSLAPGIVPVSSDNPFLLSGSYNANGQRGRANDITIDNAVATDIAVTGAAGTNTFSLDSIQEVQLITAGFAAEFGRNSGSQLQIITQGGTNNYHGSVYEFLQNSSLNARDFFDTTGKATPFQRNQWGFVAGGPIIKNRLLVSGHYEGIKNRGASSTAVATVLTPTEAAGITDPTTRALFNAVGAPQSPTGQIASAAPNTGNQYSWSLRADAFLRGGADQITVRSGNEVGTVATPALAFLDAGTNLPNYGAMNMFDARTVTIGYTHLFTPAIVNQFRFQYQRGSQAFPPSTSLQPPYAPVIDISGFNPMGVATIFPQQRVQNVFQYSDSLSWATGRHALKFGAEAFRYQENSVNATGARGEFFYTSPAAFESGSPAEYFQYVGDPGRDYRSTDVFLFAQDDIRVASTLTVNVGLRLESSGGPSEAHNVMANLDTSSPAPLGGGGSGPLGSIDLGGTAYHRNENWGPRLGVAWNPGHGKLVLRGGYGWMYDFLFLNPVLNLQFVAPYEYLLTVTNFTDGDSHANLAAGTAASQEALQAAVGTFPANQANFGSITPVQQDLKNPRTAQWNLGAEYQLSKDFVLKATYIGSSTAFLQVSLPLNLIPSQGRPAPATSVADEFTRYSSFENAYLYENGSPSGSVVNDRLDHRFNSVLQMQSTGASHYEGLQIALLKSVSHGLSLQASYTYGRAMDDVSDALNVLVNDSYQAQDPRNLASNWGPSEFDVPQRFVMNAAFAIPWTKRFAGYEGKILDGWTLDGVLTAQSGFPATILSGPVLNIPDVALLGGGMERANGDATAFHPAPVGSAAAAAIPPLCARGVGVNASNQICTDTSGFPLTQPLLGNLGDSARNQLRLANFADVDLGVYKDTRVREKVTVQFRWETYNLFNRANFSGFVNTLTSPNFGTYTSTATGPRTMQFGLKAIF